MYTPPAFLEDAPDEIRRMMREARLSTLVTSTAEGLIATPLPLLLDEGGGPWGTLIGHIAKANVQWKVPVIGEAMAILPGPEAYVSPSWYPSKHQHGRVVPTWNYVAVHAYGVPEFFDDQARLYDIVSRMTVKYEGARANSWAVTDAPAAFIDSQLKGIVGISIPILRVEGKKKLSQNRGFADRHGVAVGLATSTRQEEREVSRLISGGNSQSGEKE